jgi:catechol 2,3-dioxygenase-like lactoylglutathione lyase family enzyme
MTEVIGIDHTYIAVSDLSRSKIFYDRVLLDTQVFKHGDI